MDDAAKQSTGRLYTSLPVRQWACYVGQARNSIFYGSLKNVNGKYKLEGPCLTNILEGLPGLECPLPPFNDPSHYDISETGIIFISKIAKRSSATSPASSVYFIRLPSLTYIKEALPREITVPGLYGASSSPVFSPDSKSVAFLKMKDADYESDKNRIILIPDISTPETSSELFASEDGRGSWDRNPNSIMWGNDNETLYVVAEERGRVKLFETVVDVASANKRPFELAGEGSVSHVKSTGYDGTRLFITSSSFTESTRYTILDPSLPTQPTILHTSWSTSTESYSRAQVSEIWYPSTSGADVHAFVITPPSFEPSKQYPCILFIHGGPQSAWRDNFTMGELYSPFIFAAQGYVVVLPNITGSTGYGQAFTDSIRGQWGGRPYLDLESSVDYIKESLPFVDIERAVAFGISWGGYMINWLAGQPLGRKFKALVCDSGSFSTKAFASVTDEAWFPKHDFEGEWWREGDRANFEKWDPSRFVERWETPMFVLHNDRDFRHPIGEGVAAFNALQEKGIESSFLTFEDEGHMVRKPENMLVCYTEVLRFISQLVSNEARA